MPLSHRSRSLCVLVFVAFTAVALHSSAAWAQSSTLKGTVTNASTKRAISNVTITATSSKPEVEQVVLSDASGSYQIPHLPAGTYALRFEKDGYQSYSRSNITLKTDATIKINAALTAKDAQAADSAATSPKTGSGKK